MIETGDMSGTAARTVGQASTRIHDAIDRASGAARPAVDQVAAGAHHAVDRLSVAANQAADSINARGAQWRAAQSRITERCLTQVREKPMASVGMALAAGLLLGWLLRLR